MAITINSFGSIYNPAYNEKVIIVTSNNIAQTNFKYIADLYIGSDVIRVTAPKHPTYNTGIFDFGRIVENYISSDISKSTYGFQQNTNSYKSWFVKFGEEYGATPTVYPNLTTSSTFYSWNGIIDFLPFASYVQSPYVLNASGGNRFSTNMPTSGVIRDNEHAWLYAITDVVGGVYEARIRTYNSSGAIIQTVKVSNPFQGLTSSNDRFIRFSTGTSNLNSIASSGITSGAQPIITASVASYDVSFLTSLAYVITTPQFYRVDNTCTKNDTYRFHFLNALGGFDSFTFYRGSAVTSQISRSNFKSKVERQTSSTAYGYTAASRGQTDFNINIKDNIKVQSDWISEDVCTWLEELITSPEVYLDDATYGLVAVNILNNSYEFKQEIKEKLFNLTIDFSYSYDRTRQRK